MRWGFERRIAEMAAWRRAIELSGFPKVEIMTIVTIDESVTLTQTPDAERLMAEQLYGKGKNFIGAARLLRQCGGDEYVVLHLLCQGLEITLKALLLLRNFANYRPRLRNYGHDLMRLASDALKEFKLHPLRPAVSTALGVFTTR
jgi:hypothetical protein